MFQIRSAMKRSTHPRPVLPQAAESNNSIIGLFTAANSMRPFWAYLYLAEMLCHRHNLFRTSQLQHVR